MEKISVVVPVYNAEKYINDCIASILNQSYKNYELILVNDGSTDESGKICELYNQYDRVRYFYKTNEGVSAARNFGIIKSTGKYICFVDSDDMLEHDCLQKMISVISRYDADIVIGAYKKNYGTYMVDEHIDDVVIENKHEIVRYFEAHFREAIASSVWGKLYKKELIDRLFDVSMTMGEDLLFNINYFSRINKCISIDETVYLYNLTNSNSLTTKLSLQKYKQTVSACNAMQKWLDNMVYKSGECNNAQIKIADHFCSFVKGNYIINTDINANIRVLEELGNDNSVNRAIRYANKHFRLYNRVFFYFFCKKKYRLCVFLLGLLRNT